MVTTAWASKSKLRAIGFLGTMLRIRISIADTLAFRRFGFNQRIAPRYVSRAATYSVGYLGMVCQYHSAGVYRHLRRKYCVLRHVDVCGVQDTQVPN